MPISAAGSPAVDPVKSFDLSEGWAPSPAAWERTTIAPPAPLSHKIFVTGSLLLPLLGLIAGMALGWRSGWLDGTQLSILLIGYVLTGLGITIGYHRLLTHRSFTTYGAVRAFWLVLGALTVQKSPLEWCATHRKHHALSDKPGDPHSPHEHGDGYLNLLRGWGHAHIGWIWTGHMISTDYRRYAPDLLQDRCTMWVHRYWESLFMPLSYALPTAAGWLLTGTGEGALLAFLWGGCVRVFLVQHITFSTNSICHLFGRRDYHVDDESRNNVICGIFSGGEGFHNNHHAFPTSARHGLEWWQPDLSWYVIRLMELTGIAWDVNLPARVAREQKRIRTP